MNIKSDFATCQVQSPGNLPEGYKFNASLDGYKDIAVTVPPGGVVEGEIMEVSYPLSNERTEDGLVQTNDNVSKNEKVPFAIASVVDDTDQSDLAPIGHWRNQICDCFDICCSGVWWMGYCCHCVLAGQVMQRLKLTWCGLLGPYENTCRVTAFISVIGFALYYILFLVPAQNAAVVVLYIVVIYSILSLTRTRMYMRKKYNIPPDCCGEGCWGDCCCIYWCTCCSLIQMHRHTHDEKIYQYECCTATGLGNVAPEIDFENVAPEIGFGNVAKIV